MEQDVKDTCDLSARVKDLLTDLGNMHDEQDKEISRHRREREEAYRDLEQAKAQVRKLNLDLEETRNWTSPVHNHFEGRILGVHQLSTKEAPSGADVYILTRRAMRCGYMTFDEPRAWDDIVRQCNLSQRDLEFFTLRLTEKRLEWLSKLRWTDISYSDGKVQRLTRERGEPELCVFLGQNAVWIHLVAMLGNANAPTEVKWELLQTLERLEDCGMIKIPCMGDLYETIFAMIAYGVLLEERTTLKVTYPAVGAQTASKTD